MIVFLRHLLPALALGFTLSGPSLALANEAPERPDIVVIMGDDMGYSDLGCFGGEIRTPNLDALAASGLRFTQFYSENMCVVSRACLLTGIHHRTSLVRGRLHQRCVTLPEALRSAGYRTLLSGKWHLAGRPYTVFPTDRGFDAFYGILGGAASFYDPANLYRNRKNIEHEPAEDPGYYFTDAISDEAIRMIQETPANQPLFLNLAYTAAHWPLHAPEEDIAAYRGAYAMGWDRLRRQRLHRMEKLGLLPGDLVLSPRHPEVPAWKKEPNGAWQQRRMEVYAAQVTRMDRGIGRVLDVLRETGRFENTLVFFTVDNGACHVEYDPDRKGDYLPEITRAGEPVRPGNLPDIMPGPEDTYQSYGYGWANASNTPFRLFKKFAHEGGVRTPMIAHWPTGLAADRRGKLEDAPSHLIDLMPTILEVTGTQETGETAFGPALMREGRSLAAAFSAHSSFRGHDRLFFAHARGKAIREGDWKLVAAGKSDLEPYDLAAAPTETNDRAAEYPEKVAALERIWLEIRDRHRSRAALDGVP